MVPETELMVATAQSILPKMVELNVMMVVNLQPVLLKVTGRSMQSIKLHHNHEQVVAKDNSHVRIPMNVQLETTTVLTLVLVVLVST